MTAVQTLGLVLIVADGIAGAAAARHGRSHAYGALLLMTLGVGLVWLAGFGLLRAPAYGWQQVPELSLLCTGMQAVYLSGRLAFPPPLPRYRGAAPFRVAGVAAALAVILGLAGEVTVAVDDAADALAPALLLLVLPGVLGFAIVLRHLPASS